MDVNRDGYLDLEEIAEWVEPEGFIQAKSEVVYLMQILDTDTSLNLSLREILEEPSVFLNSQVTHYGYIYSLRNLTQLTERC